MHGSQSQQQQQQQQQRARKVGYIQVDPPQSSIGPRLSFALKLSTEVYKFVCRSPETLLPDDRLPAPGSLRNTCGLPRFVFAYLSQVYPTQALVDKVARDLLLALQDYAASEQEIDLFAKFVGSVYDADDLSFFVHGWSRVLPLYHDLVAQRSGRRAAVQVDDDEAFVLRRLWLYDEQCRLLVNELFDARERAALKPNFWRNELRSAVPSTLDEAACPALRFLLAALQQYRESQQKPLPATGLGTVPEMLQRCEAAAAEEFRATPLATAAVAGGTVGATDPATAAMGSARGDGRAGMPSVEERLQLVERMCAEMADALEAEQRARRTLEEQVRLRSERMNERLVDIKEAAISVMNARFERLQKSLASAQAKRAAALDAHAPASPGSPAPDAVATVAAELRSEMRRLRDELILPMQAKTTELDEQVTKCLVFALRELKATEGPDGQLVAPAPATRSDALQEVQAQIAELKEKLETQSKQADTTTLRLEEKFAKEVTSSAQALQKRIKELDTKLGVLATDVEQMKTQLANEAKERAKSDRENQRQRGLLAEKLQARISQEESARVKALATLESTVLDLRAIMEDQAETRDSERRALIEFVQTEAARTRDLTDETLRAEVQDSMEEVFENQLKLQLPNLVQSKIDPIEMRVRDSELRLEQAAQALELVTARLSALGDTQHTITSQSAAVGERVAQLQDALASIRATEASLQQRLEALSEQLQSVRESQPRIDIEGIVGSVRSSFEDRLRAMREEFQTTVSRTTDELHGDLSRTTDEIERIAQQQTVLSERLRRDREELMVLIRDSTQQQRRDVDQAIAELARRERTESRAAADAKLESVQAALEALQVAFDAEQKRAVGRAAHVDRLLRQRERAAEQAVKDVDTKIKDAVSAAVKKIEMRIKHDIDEAISTQEPTKLVGQCEARLRLEFQKQAKAADELHNGLVSVVHELTERLQQQERARAELARAYRELVARTESMAGGSAGGALSDADRDALLREIGTRVGELVDKRLVAESLRQSPLIESVRRMEARLDETETALRRLQAASAAAGGTAARVSTAAVEETVRALLSEERARWQRDDSARQAAFEGPLLERIADMLNQHTATAAGAAAGVPRALEARIVQVEAQVSELVTRSRGAGDAASRTEMSQLREQIGIIRNALEQLLQAGAVGAALSR